MFRNFNYCLTVLYQNMLKNWRAKLAREWRLIFFPTAIFPTAIFPTQLSRRPVSSSVFKRFFGSERVEKLMKEAPPS